MHKFLLGAQILLVVVISISSLEDAKPNSTSLLESGKMTPLLESGKMTPSPFLIPPELKSPDGGMDLHKFYLAMAANATDDLNAHMNKGTRKGKFLLAKYLYWKYGGGFGGPGGPFGGPGGP